MQLALAGHSMEWQMENGNGMLRAASAGRKLARNGKWQMAARKGKWQLTMANGKGMLHAASAGRELAGNSNGKWQQGGVNSS